MSRRDPLIDLIRAGALFVVVLWHWVFTTIRWTERGPVVGNPVAVTPGMWTLTWVLQIMPAFFMIGGYLHSTNTLHPLLFWSRRIKRLVLPVLPLLIPAAILPVVLAGIGRDDLVKGVVLVISPMWFLATYLVCVLFAPVAQRLDRHLGPWAVGPGLVVVAAVDHLRIGLGHGGALTGALAFVSVWLTVHQLGFSLGRILGSSPRKQLTVMLTGYGLLGLAGAALPYPAAMVGLDGHKLSNMGPPTLMVVLLAVGQLGLIGLCSDQLRSLARRHEQLLSRMGQWSMTVYAWHLLAYAMFWALLVRLGWPVLSTVSASWWAQRPLWLVGPMVFAIPVCGLARRFDRVRVANSAASGATSIGSTSHGSSVQVERLETHLVTDGLDRRVGERSALPIGAIDDQGVTRDEAGVR